MYTTNSVISCRSRATRVVLHQIQDDFGKNESWSLYCTIWTQGEAKLMLLGLATAPTFVFLPSVTPRRVARPNAEFNPLQRLLMTLKTPSRLLNLDSAIKSAP